LVDFEAISRSYIVFCANLKTKKSAAGRWTLAGVALIMELTA